MQHVFDATRANLVNTAMIHARPATEATTSTWTLKLGAVRAQQIVALAAAFQGLHAQGTSLGIAHVQSVAVAQ